MQSIARREHEGHTHVSQTRRYRIDEFAGKIDVKDSKIGMIVVEHTKRAAHAARMDYFLAAKLGQHILDEECDRALILDHKHFQAA